MHGAVQKADRTHDLIHASLGRETRKFDRKGLAAFLRRRGNVVIWATGYGAIMKRAMADGIDVYPFSEPVDRQKLEEMDKDICNKAGEGCKFRIIDGTDGLACLSPKTLRQMPESADEESFRRAEMSICEAIFAEGAANVTASRAQGMASGDAEPRPEPGPRPRNAGSPAKRGEGGRDGRGRQ